MTGGYEASGSSKRTSSWIAPPSGPNRVLNGALPALRNRARAAYRNNPLIFRAIESLVVNEIGKGILPRTQAPDGVRQEISGLWKYSQSELDSQRVFNFAGIQAQAARSVRMAGECFIRRRRRRANSGLAVPLQVQLLESEYCPVTKNEKLRNGNKIIAGIEFNQGMERVAYHFHPEHPTDGEPLGFKLIRVPARDVIHCYRPRRPDQVRGEPDAVQSLLKAYTFDSYDDAELVRKQTRAPITGFLEQTGYEDKDFNYDPLTGRPLERTDPDSEPHVEMVAGTILSGLYGEKLHLFSGDDSGEGYKDFMRIQMMLIASGMQLPYELMTGDWSDVNDRIVRAILNEFRRMIEMDQGQFVHQVCDRVWAWWLDAAVLSGVIDLPDYGDRIRDYRAVRWVTHSWPYVHPEQDVKAIEKEIEIGLNSRDEKVVQRGRDPEEVDQEQAEGDRRRRDLQGTNSTEDDNNAD